MRGSFCCSCAARLARLLPDDSAPFYKASTGTGGRAMKMNAIIFVRGEDFAEVVFGHFAGVMCDGSRSDII
jgi:hypothetical protein